MSSNSEQNQNQNQNQSQNSDQNYRRNRRQYNNGFEFRNYGNYYQNSGQYYPNNEWSEWQPMSQPMTQYSNDRQFANYSQNYNNFNTNESQNSFQSNENNNGLTEQQMTRTRRQGYRKPQKTYNYRPNEGNSRPNETNVGHQRQKQRSDDNSHRSVDSVNTRDMTSTASCSQPNTDRNSDNRREKAINYRKSDFNYENRRKGYQRSDDRNSGKRFDRNETNFRDNVTQSETRKVETNKRMDKSKPIPESEESQREIMDEMLRKGEFECMVCCDQIRIKDQVWSCEHCYNVFHLKCIKMWANSESAHNHSNDQNINWRCPACQALHPRLPTRYYCFCRKVKDPELNRYLVPHSCGEMCGRKRKHDPNRKHNCPHKCMLLCHPGSCPPCQLKVTRECGCGQNKITVNCDTNDEQLVCDNICNKALNCGQHFCQRVCHFDECNDCSVIKTRKCFCDQNEVEVQCNVENNLIESYCCQQKCQKPLKCANHKCDQICHFGDCNDCPFNPKLVTHCCCGKTELKELMKSKRQSCTDPIPTCTHICDKVLVCGPDKERHRCRNQCHSGVCPPCDQKTVIRCRCGANSDNIECIQLTDTQSKAFICKKRCNRKRVCGRHKCLNECCIDSQHKCQQICAKKLSCGRHTCEELCHNNACPQCWNISWDELSCRCGAAIKLPPIACGTQRPECELKCSRYHTCNHPIDHNCHDDAECPPCTYFTGKTCYGGHEKRSVHCYETGFSCGYLCVKPLDCGLHECQMLCHFGDCNECTLPCTKIREDCEHLCGLRCHQKSSSDVCPKSNCKVMIKVQCDCGRKTDQMPCFKVNGDNNLRLSMNTLANQRIKNGESVDVTAILKNFKDFRHIQLKCDEKCAVIERNRQLAEALDIKDADFSPEPGPPKYSELLKNGIRSDPTFVSEIYNKLSKLVIESKQSKLQFKNFNFPAMSSENRHIIHEMAEHFGCKTHAVDREPNRSVVVKAPKDKCYLPTVSLMDVVKEEIDCRRLGVNNNKSNKITLKSHSFDTESNETNNVLSVNTGLSIIRNISNDSNHKNNNQQNAKPIDYFDFKGD